MEFQTDKIIYNVNTNKTFRKFLELCNIYNINIFNNNKELKSIDNLLDDYKIIRKKVYNNHIIKILELEKQNLSCIDEIIYIEDLTLNLKKTLKDLDILYELLTKIYTDKTLSYMFPLKKNEIMFIEEFSNMH